MSSSAPERELAETLQPPQRMALAYAPLSSRQAWLGFFALDARLSKVVRAAREPLIGQVRLAWWRDRLAERADEWPQGEPLLAFLREWDGEHGGFLSVVDGWEVLFGEPPLDAAQFLAAARGRAAGAGAVARRLGAGRYAAEAARLAQTWALADFAERVADPREAEVLGQLFAAEDRSPARLPRDLRPLVVLHGLTGTTRSGMAQFLTALRLGILGR